MPCIIVNLVNNNICPLYTRQHVHLMWRDRSATIRHEHQHQELCQTSWATRVVAGTSVVHVGSDGALHRRTGYSSWTSWLGFGRSAPVQQPLGTSAVSPLAGRVHSAITVADRREIAVAHRLRREAAARRRPRRRRGRGGRCCALLVAVRHRLQTRAGLDHHVGETTTVPCARSVPSRLRLVPQEDVVDRLFAVPGPVRHRQRTTLRSVPRDVAAEVVVVDSCNC